MSEGNVEIVQEWIEAWNRREIEHMLGSFHPDIEWRTSGAFPDLDPLYSGHDGFRRFWLDFTDPWEWFVISADELRDCGDQVLSLGAFEGQAREGMRVQRQSASVWTFRNQLAVSVRVYGDWANALEAARA